MVLLDPCGDGLHGILEQVHPDASDVVVEVCVPVDGAHVKVEHLLVGWTQLVEELLRVGVVELPLSGREVSHDF